MKSNHLIRGIVYLAVVPLLLVSYFSLLALF